MSSDLERTFLFHCAAQKLPAPVTEYRFDPVRRWRFDCAWLDAKVAVELEGGTYMRGRHVRGEGFAKDCEKANAATSQGWRLYRFTSDMLRADPVGCVEQVRRALGGRCH